MQNKEWKEWTEWGQMRIHEKGGKTGKAEDGYECQIAEERH